MKIIEPNVKLVTGTPEPLKTIAIAAKLTHSKNVNYDITNEEAERMVRQMIKLGHTSTLEHVQFTFEVACSRTCSHQIVRHRIGTAFSQRSERYVEADPEIIIPPEIKKDTIKLKRFKQAAEESFDAYHLLTNLGITKEDARFILPRIATKMIFSLNGRALRHFIKLRDSKDAQWEIREVAQQIKELVPNLLVSDLQ